MGRRMFAAVVPPEDVREDLAAFLEPREGLSWTPPDRMHVTLAFLADVPERILEPLEERLARAVGAVEPFACSLAGAGAFPHPDRPAVLWLGVQQGADALERLARRVRDAASTAGAAPDGKRFTAHLTLARPPRQRSAVRWLHVLDTYRSRTWEVDEVELIDSQLLGHGRRALHETVARLPLGA
ncbi:RNA 2',3'-cyclic phosphodiesterase [Agrococcus sp. HG114]|uniref:RNA 2',3'-cyclic phosphodiesterase n=1 Tax=Agrococcus sp. HG114 TaxID=2969757 RepID=UPI00215B26B1|nr:RNA 2',3'-cyclic phosphodiesterase [Agrococcus sp. HG114]MCR8670788.1 RNA 2',3'-cyclic phosphodiesterase [Agrococcus sp. HG114]